MSSETQKHKHDLENSLIELKQLRNTYDEKRLELQAELKDIKIRYQRLMLDNPDQSIEENRHLSHIKDEHTKLVVEND